MVLILYWDTVPNRYRNGTEPSKHANNESLEKRYRDPEYPGIPAVPQSGISVLYLNRNNTYVSPFAHLPFNESQQFTILDFNRISTGTVSHNLA